MVVQTLRRATLAAWGLERVTAVVVAAAFCGGGVVEGMTGAEAAVGGRAGLEVKVGLRVAVAWGSVRGRRR